MDPTFQRSKLVSLADLPGTLPTSTVPEKVDHASVTSQGIQFLSSLKEEHLAKEAIWRDQWALTGTTRTFVGPHQVFAAWSELAITHRPDNFSLAPNTSKVVHGTTESAWIQAEFTFKTGGRPGLYCHGLVGLVIDETNQPRIWLISTVLESIKGLPNPDVFVETKLQENNEPNDSKGQNVFYFDCVVVGAGMAGLATAGRLKAMGVSAVALESNAQIGDNWTQRYASAKLHTGREYGHLPFSRTFPPEENYFLTSADLAQGYRRFVQEYGINVWLSSTLESATWNKDKDMWKLIVKKDKLSEMVTIDTRHVVLCIGAGGQVPRMPSLPNQSIFEGKVLHSVDYKSPEGWAGKVGLVVGSANTAHDVAHDMVMAGLKSVTMIQRNQTIVVPQEDFNGLNNLLYNQNIPTEVADRRSYALPIVVSRKLAMSRAQDRFKADPERYAALERAGFKLDRNPDFMSVINERLGGHYMDVGAGKLIADGKIKIKSDAAIKSFTRTGLQFDDGSTLDADVIVFCTGFEGNMRHAAARIFGPEVDKGLEDFWGVNAEGEIRGAWKPQGYPGIWYHGGTIGHARYYSRFIALQIKADLEGIPLQVYKKTPSVTNPSS
ncbi:flavin-containing monooxygenase [Xylogone sp. PMI_703]|nr:flavin-containing monooxygenase [Xylogone sp. PMI_703]